MTPDREAELVRLVLAMADKIYLMSSHLSRLAERRHQGGLTMSKQTCENCKFFRAIEPKIDSEGEDYEDGQCRRFPPVLVEYVPEVDFAKYSHVEVTSRQWCGEWKALEGDSGNRVAE